MRFAFIVTFLMQAPKKPVRPLKSSSAAFSRRTLNFKRPIPLQNFLFTLSLTVFFLLWSNHPHDSLCAQGMLRVHFMDVGYGDAILIQFPGSGTMLVDAGEASYADTVIEYLGNLGLEDIDTAVITHPHTNHFGGFGKIAGRYPIGRVFINGDEWAEEGYSAILDQLKAARIPVKTLTRGQHIDNLSEGVRVIVLHPEGLAGGPNDNSLVLSLKYGDTAILLMGDVEVEAQRELFAAFPDIVLADAVKLPHHGGPLSDGIFEAMQAKVVIISTGENKWGWPREDDLKKIRGVIYRTDRDGTVILESDGTTVSAAKAGKREATSEGTLP